MSVDLSAPEIQVAHQQILDKADPTTWFILSYGSPPSALQLVSSGRAPPLPQIREILAETSEDVLFGYAEVGGKGLIIAFMRDNVGGVRRARAVVHSRAVASLFPDYAALITVAHPSQLSDEDVAEKLGLDAQPRQAPDNASHPSSQIGTPGHDPRYPAHLGKHTPTHLALGRQSPAQAASPVEPSPPVPEKDYPVSASQTFPSGSGSKSTTSLASGESQRSRTSSNRGGPSTPRSQRHLQLAGEEVDGGAGAAGTTLQHRAHTNGHDQLDKMTTPSGKPSPLPLAPPTDTTPTSYSHQRIVSAPVHSHSPIEHKGIASTDVFPDSAQRNRKASLTSRLGQLSHAFGRSSPKSPKSPSVSSPNTGGVFGHGNGTSAPSPSSPKESKSPGSPSIARFMNSNLARNFGRRASGGPTPPASPGAADSRRESVPPPPPPKDGEESVDTYTPPAESSGASSASRRGEEDVHVRDDTRGLLGVGADQDILARSNSAQRALSEASQKRLKDESEIQEKFRRDEEERARAREKQRMSSQSVPAVPSDQDDEDDGVDGILERYTRDSVYVDSRDGNVPNDGNEPVPTLDRRYESEEEEDFGLPYDRPDPDSPLRPRRRLPVPPAAAAIPVLGAPIGQSHSHAYDHTPAAPTRLPVHALGVEDPATSDTLPSRLTTPSASYHTPAPAASTPGAVEDEARELEPHQGLKEEVRGDDSVTERFLAMDVAEDGHAGGKAVEMSMLAEAHAQEKHDKRGEETNVTEREAEEHRSRVRNEYMRREQEREEESRRLAQEAEAEATRQAEEAQKEEEERQAAQRKHEEEFKAEEARREQERVQEERRLEEERLAEEGQKEQDRLAEERRLEEERDAEVRRKEEERVAEEERREVQRAEAERKRKEETLAGLQRGKESGGVMLSGWITVQTSKSMIWRRRWFNFYANEIKLFKSELDTKPIQVVPLGRAVLISHTYEESQVQGSFKVTDETGDEWYMFTDGAEEKATVLAAFALSSA